MVQSCTVLGIYSNKFFQMLFGCFSADSPNKTNYGLCGMSLTYLVNAATVVIQDYV